MLMGIATLATSGCASDACPCQMCPCDGQAAAYPVAGAAAPAAETSAMPITTAASFTGTALSQGPETAEVEGPSRNRGLASTGWITARNSLIHPYCAGVVVAPDVVVTTTKCTRPGASAMRFGLGMPRDEGTIPVAFALPLSADPRLSALLLAEPVVEAEPARATSATTETDVTGVGISYALVGEPADRWIWHGVLSPTEGDPEVNIDEGESSCHGDSGVGVYTSEGALLGVVVAVRGGDPCTHTLILSGPDSDAARDPFREARELSEMP